VLLILVPWSPFWERNYFSDRAPMLRDLVGNHYVRGGVSGLGAVNLSMGLIDLATLVAMRRAAQSSRGSAADAVGPGLAGEEWRSRGAR
jgi:hypothetical protein